MARRNEGVAGKVAKGIGVGVVVGCVAGVAGAYAAHNNKNVIKKKVGNAWKSAGNTVEQFTDNL